MISIHLYRHSYTRIKEPRICTRDRQLYSDEVSPHPRNTDETRRSGCPILLRSRRPGGPTGLGKLNRSLKSIILLPTHKDQEAPAPWDRIPWE